MLMAGEDSGLEAEYKLHGGEVKPCEGSFAARERSGRVLARGTVVYLLTWRIFPPWV